MHQPLQIVTFVVVASTPAGAPIYSVYDIAEPLPRYSCKILRGARRTAGLRGYVLVGRAGLPWSDYEATARRVEGI